jgi:alkanesulfonate monooxygenase SsuD/methylene tetrahydromethanopterin reductase-like flavin-dependent oxidoreductase (luciferase family)
MKFGFVIPWADAEEIGELAAVAEENGWDGIFVWEPVWGVDTWISLGLAAMRTSRIRLGTMLTPPSRRRPWELASQVATVDRLSGGRVTLAVGLGAIDSGFAAFGEECDRRLRAELMDECLEVACGLWHGQPYSFSGKHFNVEPTDFPTIGHTVQKPRVPIWCVGALGSPRSMLRAARWDGLIPQVIDNGSARQATLSEIARWTAARSDDEPDHHRPYDIVIEGKIADHSPAAWADAGATWWLETQWDAVGQSGPALASFDRLREGPPAP